MSDMFYSVISGTGSYIPSRQIKNDDFLNHEFYDANSVKLDKSNREILDKFLEITSIGERRYVTDDLMTSEIAYYAAIEAIEDATIDKEELDYIIVAHNFGDVKNDNKNLDIVPSIAARVKHKLGIANPHTVVYDVIFGCPAWLQAMIQADYYIRSGDAKKVLLIGAETLSRVCDPHDRDSMLYSDGAGATVLESKKSDSPVGIIAHKTRSDTLNYSQMLYMGKSFKPDYENDKDTFLKMSGRKLYQYALERVPQAIKECLEKADIPLAKVSKVLIHQANEKMDEAILERLYTLYGIEKVPEGIMPMTISWLGNSSVATLPTLLDLILKDKLKPHQIKEGNIIVFASVGAGMNINAVVYKA